MRGYLLLPLLLASLIATSVSAQTTPDPRARDAVAIFSDLCVSSYTGQETGYDHSQIDFQALPDDTVREIKPELAGQKVWAFHSRTSDLNMIIYTATNGLCVGEVAEAEEASLQAAFAEAAVDSAKFMSVNATAQPEQTREIEGMTATNRSWRMPSKDGDIMMMITTAPEPKFMFQAMMSVSYVR